MISIYFYSSAIESHKNILVKMKYFVDILISFISNKVIKAFYRGWIFIFIKLKIDIICTTNFSFFKFSTTSINNFLLIISTRQKKDKFAVLVYLFYLSFFSIDYIFILLKVRKQISNIIFLLVLTNKKVL